MHTTETRAAAPSGPRAVRPSPDAADRADPAASRDRHARPELSLVVLAYQEEARIGASLL